MGIEQSTLIPKGILYTKTVIQIFLKGHLYKHSHPETWTFLEKGEMS